MLFVEIRKFITNATVRFLAIKILILLMSEYPSVCLNSRRRLSSTITTALRGTLHLTSIATWCPLYSTVYSYTVKTVEHLLRFASVLSMYSRSYNLGKSDWNLALNKICLNMKKILSKINIKF